MVDDIIEVKDDLAIFEAPDIIELNGGGGPGPEAFNTCKDGSGWFN